MRRLQIDQFLNNLPMRVYSLLYMKIHVEAGLRLSYAKLKPEFSRLLRFFVRQVDSQTRTKKTPSVNKDFERIFCGQKNRLHGQKRLCG
jgi:hypothetical protein